MLSLGSSLLFLTPFLVEPNNRTFGCARHCQERGACSPLASRIVLCVDGLL